MADGLGGGYQRERVLGIMKDSRIGAFGAMALVLAFTAKFALLARLGSQGLAIALWSLLGGHVVSRFWPLIAVRTLPHVGDTATSKSKPLADQIHHGCFGHGAAVVRDSGTAGRAGARLAGCVGGHRLQWNRCGLDALAIQQAPAGLHR